MSLFFRAPCPSCAKNTEWDIDKVHIRETVRCSNCGNAVEVDALLKTLRDKLPKRSEEGSEE